MNSFTLSTQVYYDQFMQTYYNIIVVNTMPSGPLSRIVRRIQTPIMRTFNAPMNGWNTYDRKPCLFALMALHPSNYSSYMSVEEVPNLLSYLLANGYKVDTSITKLLSRGEVRYTDGNVIAFVTYN